MFEFFSPDFYFEKYSDITPEFLLKNNIKQMPFNIFCCLFQVKSHVWNFVITGKLEADNGIFDAVFVFFSHSFILQRK